MAAITSAAVSSGGPKQPRIACRRGSARACAQQAKSWIPSQEHKLHAMNILPPDGELDKAKLLSPCTALISLPLHFINDLLLLDPVHPR